MTAGERHPLTWEELLADARQFGGSIRYEAVVEALLARAVTAEAALALAVRAHLESEDFPTDAATVAENVKLYLSRVAGSSPAAEAETCALTLNWECEACGLRWVVDAPGFPGDGSYHYTQPDNVACGPIYANRTSKRAASGVSDTREGGRGETWDCGCPFAGPHNENCALAASPVPAVADDPEPRYVWTIDYDNECYGIYATKEAAEEGLARQIADGGPAWDACEVHRHIVAGPGSRDTKEPTDA